MRVMSAGHGYRYLLDSVAIGDGAREPGRALTDYYTQPGCPPGRWLGSGLQALGDGQLQAGDVVTEVQLGLLLGAGCDPVTGVPLGRAHPAYRSRQERISTRVARLDDGRGGEQRAAAIARIEAEEAARATRRAVAGFDVTFSVPKSVSVLWALADPDIQERIIAAHHAAIADVIALLERDVAATRMGATGPDGAVAQVPVTGVSAVAFDHFDSRAGDPQLHTHVVIANKVQTAADGKWRSLDGRPIHAAMVALSEHYNATLADHLTRTLGLTWSRVHRGRDRNPAWEITGVPQQLIELFSSRSQTIEVATDQLIADYAAQHGRQPTRRTIIRLRQQATLTSRPDKVLRSLADLRDGWHARATALLTTPADDWARGLLTRGRRTQQLLRDGDVAERLASGIAAQVLDVVGERRSTWRRWNLHAEASRQLMGVRFASSADRDRVLTRVVDAAEQASVRLTPPELAAVPVELQRPDGTSVLRPAHGTVYTSQALLDAEAHLLELSGTTTASRVPDITVAGFVDGLGDDQAAAVATVATSGRVVDVLIGPAGAGKTTAMRSLREAWEHLYGTGSVVGLAPSAGAAEVLGDDLGVSAETCAKWLHDQGPVRPAQLLIIDEASLAGTHTLDRLTRRAAAAGAKVLLVGDPAQLAAVDAGGAFALLASHRPDTAELTDVRRFHHGWEATATLQLRNGNPAVIDTYAAHGRLHDGETEAMLDAAYTAWRGDIDAGQTSLLIAPTRDQVTALNTRARADRIATGDVDPTIALRLHDGTLAGPGDTIVTRRNNRCVTSASGRWVRNGDRWTITRIHPDGSITATSPIGGRVRLPVDYIAAHVELGYATTVHRAQGATVDTAHAIVTGAMTRETVYVAMTRGRHANTAYAITDQPDREAHQDEHPGDDGRQILERVLGRIGAEPSAHHALRDAQDRYSSIVQLAAEYDTIATVAQRDRWTHLIHHSGLTVQQAAHVLTSPAFEPLTATLRRADAHHLVPERLLPRVVAGIPLDDADNIAAVLHHRITDVLNRSTGRRDQQRPPHLIAGLIPRATGPMPQDLSLIHISEPTRPY